MLLFIILGAIVLLAFVVVGSLVYMLNKASAQQTVPIKDVNEFRKSFLTPQEDVKVEKLHVSVEKSVLSDFESKESSQSSEDFTVKEDLYQKKVSQLEEQLQAVSQETQKQASEALATKEVEYQKKVAELEVELQTISQKAQRQSQEALEAIEQLQKENERLKSEQNNRVTSAEANLIKAQDTITTLHEEQGALQNRLSQSQAEVQRLQDEVVFIKQQMAQEIVLSKSEKDNLITENQTLQRSLEVTIANATKNLQEEADTLRGENQTLKNAMNDLTMTNQKLKDLNEHLIEKSESLQWELTKARAQMTSYERSCENYQNQLKNAFDSKGSVEENYSKLNETNNRIQETLERLQLQNQELSKREKVFEFELEKNRNQLVSLQRDYENLKAQQQG